MFDDDAYHRVRIVEKRDGKNMKDLHMKVIEHGWMSFPSLFSPRLVVG